MVKVETTWLDKTIMKYSPAWGARRLENRVYAQMLSAYEATRPGNRPFDGFPKFLTSPNSRVSKYDLQTLTNYSRFLCQSGLGSVIPNRLTDHAIGSGLVFRSSIDGDKLKLTKEQKEKKQKELTRFWYKFWQGENGDYFRMYSGGYFQAQAFKSMCEGGDSFVLPVAKKKRNNHPFPFALQLLESERIQTPRGLENDPDFYLGFQKNPQGIPVKVWSSKNKNRSLGQTDPGYFNPDDWESRSIFGSNTGIRQVFQCKNLSQDRPGALRGIPLLTPAMGLIIDHKELTEAVLQAAKIQSIFAAFWKGPDKIPLKGGAPTGKRTDATTSTFPRIDLTKGQIGDLTGTNAELVPFESKQPGENHMDHMLHIVAIIGAITGLAKSFILLWMDRNYSANRGEVAMTWVTILRYRLAFIMQTMFPFWEYLLSWGVASGNISAPGFFDDPEIKAAWLGQPQHQFSGPRMPSLDIEKEAKGMTLMRDGGFDSTRGLIESNSEKDPDSVFSELLEEKVSGILDIMAKTTQNSMQENKQPAQEGEDDAN